MSSNTEVLACKHERGIDGVLHTCTDLYDSAHIYCVYCMWDRYMSRTPIEVALDDLPDASDVDWPAGDYRGCFAT